MTSLAALAGSAEMDYSRPELADALAAEYVCGALRGAARRRFETLLPAHANLRSATHAWQARLMPLTASLAPVEPSPEVWQRIETRLFGAAAVASRRRGFGAWLGTWLGANAGRELALWRSVAAFAGVCALGLGGLLAQPGEVLPPVIVVLSAATPAPGSVAGSVVPASFVASISGDGRALVTRPLVNVSLEADRSLELWAIPPAGAPHSMGLIAADKLSVVQRGRLPGGTVALAVSLEPTGGSPTGAPTGPVLYVGKLTL